MSFEDLTHTPEFDLPANAPSPPADLISLLEECHLGLHKAIVSKMVRRGKYEQVAVVLCQENPNKQSKPTATADDIADYCMMCMQAEMDKSDDPGTYRVMLIGPPGRGRFERSKHVDLGDGDGMARSKTMMSEGDLVDKQSEYIGELHSQIVAMSETVHSMLKPLLQENKEMAKIISDASRKHAEVERERMRHELELKMHADSIKLEESKEEMKSERWKETMGTIKESGAVEGVLKALLRKLNSRGDDSDDDDEEDEEEEEVKAKSKSKPSGRPTTSKVKRDATPNKERESKLEKAKQKSGKPKFKKRKSASSAPQPSSKKSAKESPLSADTVEAIENGDDLSQDQIVEVFEEVGMQKAKDNPTAVMVEILKMMIDEKDQWELIEETLSKDQMIIFKKIIKSEKDSVIHRLLKQLYELKGARRLLKLEDHLDKDQKKYMDKLLEIAMK